MLEESHEAYGYFKSSCDNKQLHKSCRKMSQRASKRKHKNRQVRNNKQTSVAPLQKVDQPPPTPSNLTEPSSAGYLNEVAPLQLLAKVTPATHALDRYDLDIMVVAYNVHAMIKHTPLVEENIERAKLYLYIDNFVKNKVYFENILIDAQRKRNIEALSEQGIMWFEKTVQVDQDDIYKWSLVEDDEGK